MLFTFTVKQWPTLGYVVLTEVTRGLQRSLQV